MESENHTVDGIADEMLRLGEKWTAEDTTNKTECLGLIVTQFARRIKEAWKHERDEFVYSFDQTKAAKSKAPDGSAYAMDGLARDPAYREIISDGRNEENKPKSDWTVREALDFANTLANHGWTSEANADAASSCIYAMCRMLKGHSNSAAIREALERIHTLVNSLDEECGVDPIDVRDIARAALSKPPRNCELFSNADDAKMRFNYLWNFVWKRSGGILDERAYRDAYDRWLFAPAEEGGRDASDELH